MIVFTDLDGTLLDHEGYSYSGALNALALISARSIPLVMVTSKTFPEVVTLQQEMGLRLPFVVENGGAVAIPRGYFPSAPPADEERGDWQVYLLGEPYEKLVDLYQSLAFTLALESHGFSQMSVAEVAFRTGLDQESAAMARDRLCSEPIAWEDGSALLAVFSEKVAEAGFTLVKGGRFFHLMGHQGKGFAVEWLLQRYRESGIDPGITVGLGDSANDLEMLQRVDLAVVIPRPNGEQLSVPGQQRLVIAPAPGSSGWGTTMEIVLEEVIDE